ncbi:hypothetical protein N7475_002276 [Penicillium sp. IBT 31633x]|nr:hypothetical protein N7475_002276 [Penicillium sp. IBT 31633x]
MSTGCAGYELSTDPLARQRVELPIFISIKRRNLASGWVVGKISRNLDPGLLKALRKKDDVTYISGGLRGANGGRWILSNITQNSVPAQVTDYLFGLSLHWMDAVG